MPSRLCYFAAIAVLAFCLFVAPAGATHVQCGDTLTTSTTLDSDVVCPDDYQPYGLLIGADNVLLRMNGYALRAGLGGGGVGIGSASPDTDGLQGVRIKRGSIEGFLGGIDFDRIDDSTFFKLSVTTNAFDSQERGDSGILLTGHRNRVEESTVNLLDPFGSVGIHLTGNDAYAWGNVVAGNPEGFLLSGVEAIGDRPRLVYNRVAGCNPFVSATGVGASGYRDYAVVNRNLVSDCQDGVVVLAAVDHPAGGARVALNHTTGGGVGIGVRDAFATVNRNIAEEAYDTGILLSLPGTFVRANAANNNGIFGIYGTEGTVDGGGNVASGNGDGSTPQCVNVQCSSP